VSSPADNTGAKYLLSLQVLLDLCGTVDNPARAWAQSVNTSRLRLSVITVALARSFVNGAGPAQDGDRLRARLVDLLAKLKADGGEPLPFDEGAAAAWQSFMREPSLTGMTQVDRQFCAVAFSEGLCAVEYEHSLSSALGPLGVKVHNLGARS
jgi:hypothetical protein